ncbi:hypothetical protein E3P78_03995 [Wallemia ichthyophaga]|nr:hypothetical protein E3P78_03995 [Wallemia ichthyophaga]
MSFRRAISTAATLTSLATLTAAHAGHHHAEEGSEMNKVPLDWIIIVHIVTQVLVWLVVFPIGMVLGSTRSKWHVPVQSAAMVVTGCLGYLSGMKHKGRQFPSSVHSTMSVILIFYLVAQAAMGIFLKLHVMEDTRLRSWIVKTHGITGKTFPIVGWVQVVFGIATVGSYCRGGSLGQCLAHYIMGSAFIWYGVLYAVLLHIGAQSAISRGGSQEMVDSTVIMLWGIVNTFTEHHGGPWTHKDLQHTMLGVLWWCGGALGMFMSRKGTRSIIPAGIIIMTGYVMSGHAQSMEISTKIHALFGYTLMTAGVTRIIDICFISNQEESSSLRTFQHLPPYLLILSGSLFMSATDEELSVADSHNFDHATLYMYLTRGGGVGDNKDTEMQHYERLSVEERQRQQPETIFDSSEETRTADSEERGTSSQLWPFNKYMNPLFYHLLQKDLNNFRLSLDSSTKQPSSLSKSAHSITPATELRSDVNQRDDKGRTALHLIASMRDENQLDFARLALSQPNINVNLQDAESGWTALHRAMYCASIAFARLLLARDDVDLSVKDREGYTAFDLYNLTIDGALPNPHHSSRSELFTWGTNRNYVLGNAHGDDRQFPERISIKRVTNHENPVDKFKYLNVDRVFMSKLHTGIITDEHTNNVRFCGFGNGGRLGRSVHAQYAFEPLASPLDVKVVDMALAQEHTLLLDADGHVYSFGLNKHQQLGYAVDAPTSHHAKFTNSSDPFQITPKRIFGALKKEVMEGVAAGKTASACWKNDTLFTWGTNEGHLGYDKSSTPIQNTPRKVTSIKQNVLAVAISDRSMCVLTDSGDVTAFYNSAYAKLSFPHFKSDRMGTGAASARIRPTITKVKCSSNTFGALSSLGEVFVFASPNETTNTIKPQKVWSFRNQFTAVRDFDVGLNGTIVLCTLSGSVFVKTAKNTLDTIPPSWKESSKTKSSKFFRVPYLHRVSEVHASDSGAFAALRKPPAHKAIYGGRDSLGDDMRSGMYLGGGVEDEEVSISGDKRSEGVVDDDNSQHEEDDDIDAKIAECDVFFRRYTRRSDNSDAHYSDSHVGGFDGRLKCNSGEVIPFHKSVYASRSPVLKGLLEGDRLDGLALSGSTLKLPDSLSHPLTLHILNKYLYTDSLLSIWDPRVIKPLLGYTTHDQALRVRDTLGALCKLLRLGSLEPFLETLVVRDVPRTLGIDLGGRIRSGVVDGDVRLNFIDNKYAIVDGVVLKSRVEFFKAMFDNPIWTESRRRRDQQVHINLTHMRLEIFEYILHYAYGCSDVEVVDAACAASGDMNDYLNTLFEVVEYANELMMDRLKDVVSSAIRPLITLNSAVGCVEKALHYECHALVDSILEDLATQVGMVLEKGVLEEMSGDVVLLLEKQIRGRQHAHMPTKEVYAALVDGLVESNKEWLAEEDIPQPILQTHMRYWNNSNTKSPKAGPHRMSGSGNLIMSPKARQSVSGFGFETGSPPATPDIAPLNLTCTANIPPMDDIFDMDEDRGGGGDIGAGSGSGSGVSTPAANAGGKNMSSPWQQAHQAQTPNSAESSKVADLRSIIQAEAEASTSMTGTSAATTPTPALPKLYGQSPGLSSSKISQKDKRKLASEREKQEKQERVAGGAASTLSGLSGSPSKPPTPAWRVPERRTWAWGSEGVAGVAGVAGASGAIQQPSTRPAPSTTPSKDPSNSPSARRSEKSNVIVPSREGRKGSSASGKAWSQTQAFASPPLSSMSTLHTQHKPNAADTHSLPLHSNTFEAIQSEQRDLALLHSAQHSRQKKSMVEIQREEREREEEEAFLRWWAEEERRTKEAMEVGRHAVRSYHRPIPAGELPVHDLALEVLAEDKRRVQVELAELRADAEKHSHSHHAPRIAQLEVLQGSNDPEVVHNFKHGLVDMSKAYYRYLSRKDFEQRRRDKLMERLNQMKVIPDVTAPFSASVELVVDFPADQFAEEGSEKRVRPVIPGAYVRAGLSRQRPEISVKIFDAEEALYSVIIVDPDVPDASSHSYKPYLHYLGRNLKLSATTTQVELNGMLDSGVLPYTPPRPAKGSGYHRYTVLLVRQTTQHTGDVARDGFSVREFIQQTQGVAVAAHMWRAVHDSDSSEVFKQLNIPEPVYGYPKKDSKYLE